MDKVAEKYVSNLLRKENDWPWPKFGKRLNEYLVHLERLLSPDLMIIGGGVSKHFEKYSSCLSVDSEVQPAQLLNTAGTVGAAMYAKAKL
jgi:polyphosphate glucokinase